MTNVFNQFNFQKGLKKGHVTLILVNVLVFILAALLRMLVINYNFQLNAPISKLLDFPWTLVTNLFFHGDFFHLFFNLIFLFAVGSLFEKYYGKKGLYLIYLFGGIFGNVMHVLIMNQAVYGASASIMALFVAVTLYQPKLPVMLFGVINFPIYSIALVFIIFDLVGLGMNDQKAHLAHLCGAFFGLIYYLGINKFQGISGMNAFDKILFLKNRNTSTRYKTDEEYNEEKFKNQQRVDQILDKISRSGYDSLSKSERDFLFKQGKR